MEIIAEPQLIRLVTERLILRPALPPDAAQIRAYNLYNHKHLQPWQPTRPAGFSTLTTSLSASPAWSAIAWPVAACIC